MHVIDTLVVGFYLVFMFLLGPIYNSFSKTSSDFFRGGGGMLWWVVGSSAFMTTFTAWAFTAGAAKAYETGTFYLLLFACNLVALVFCYFFVVAKYRRMRIITVMEAVRKRFGRTSEQILTWLLILTRILYGGAALYTIAVFMTSVFDVPMSGLIVVLGVTITLMTVFGGAWSATAGDFVQMIVVAVITVTLGVLSLVRVGGVGAFLQTLPPRHLDWTRFARPSVIVFFVITLCINQAIQMNSLIEGAARFIFVKNARDARKAIVVQAVGMVALSAIWIIPPMLAATWHPNLAAEYPDLNHPNEAAYVAMAKDLLPTGLLGLLVCGIFAATVTSLNSQLNIVGGSFVRNIYIQVIRPQASEAEQIRVGRLFMLLYGGAWILLGLCFQRVEGLELFDLILLMAACIGLPLATPLFLGIFFKKTPPWAGWSTMVAGFVPALVMSLLLKVEPVVQWLWRDPDMSTDRLVMRIWPAAELSPREIGDLKIALTTAVVAAVSTGWFFLTLLFYRKDQRPYVDEVERFFCDMASPIGPDELDLGEQGSETRQVRTLGTLCLVYGGFILLLVAVPNPPSGRWTILCCGALVAGIGAWLRILARRRAWREGQAL